MNAPSSVSSSDIPAAKRIGRQTSAGNGSPPAAAPPASTSSETSVAVSKPRPKTTPSGYMCHDVLFGDRKSTRLNSSHRCSSYAVFCLKKKKNFCIIQSYPFFFHDLPTTRTSTSFPTRRSSDLAAKRIGRQTSAGNGSPPAAAPPASTSSETSVAVSKPRPKSTPSGYMCHDVLF